MLVTGGVRTILAGVYCFQDHCVNLSATQLLSMNGHFIYLNRVYQTVVRAMFYQTESVVGFSGIARDKKVYRAQT